MSEGEIRTAHQARQVLGVQEGADIDALRRAFRAAVRKAHPDRGGDAQSLRRVIEAHRLLSNLLNARLHLAPAHIADAPATSPAPPAAEPHAWPLEIDVAQAVCGGEKEIRLPDGRAGKLKLPPGLRPGDRVRLRSGGATVHFRIAYAPGPLEAHGDDLWMTASVPAALMRDGGEIAVDTPTGRKLVIVSPGAQTLRLSGQGLPARGGHAQGRLFVRLTAEAAPSKTPARDLLRRFAAVWAA